MDKNLTGKQLVDQGIITGTINPDNIAQHGVDLNVNTVQKISGIGRIPKEGKTRLVIYDDVKVNIPDSGNPFWYLEPGAYNVEFDQGCKVPKDKMLFIRQRSSAARNGTFLHSSIFDAGFETKKIGTMIIVIHPIEIEVGARIAQIYAHNSNEVENLYDGQFKNDEWRNKKG